MLKRKQAKASFKPKNVIFTSKPLQLLYMDLIGASRIRSHGGNYYVLVIIDDFSIFTQTLFLSHKSDTFGAFKKLAKTIQYEKRSTIVSIRSNHDREFENEDFTCYCIKTGISNNFLTPRTPYQDRVIEKEKKKKKGCLEEMAKTMLNDNPLLKSFWVDVKLSKWVRFNRLAYD